MSFASILYNIRTNPSTSLIDVTTIFMSLDSTDLGLRNLDGNLITPQQFMAYLKRECDARNATPKSLLWDGDPSKENRYTADGEVSSAYLD